MSAEQPDVVVRPMRPEDVPAVYVQSTTTFNELDTALGNPTHEITDESRARGHVRISHLQTTDPDGAWVAERDGEIVGSALASRRGGLWFLSLLTVATGLQGAGVGRRLLDAAHGTADGASAGFLLASEDAKALRRYALAGFALHPGYDAKGRVDRAGLPADDGVRETDLPDVADLVADVVLQLRGHPVGPDLEALHRAGIRTVVAESGADRGYCLFGPSRIASVGATDPGLAQRLLSAGLARVGEEVDVSFITGDQQWALAPLLAARLPLRPGSSSARRGALGPMTPYLPTGIYG